MGKQRNAKKSENFTQEMHSKSCACYDYEYNTKWICILFSEQKWMNI